MVRLTRTELVRPEPDTPDIPTRLIGWEDFCHGIPAIGWGQGPE